MPEGPRAVPRPQALVVAAVGGGPLLPFAGMAAHALSGHEIGLALPLLISYGLMPLLDAWIGEDENNPPEEVVPQLEADHYYRWLTWVTVPLHFVRLSAALGGSERRIVVVGAAAARLCRRHRLRARHQYRARARPQAQRGRAVAGAPGARGAGLWHFTVEHGRGHHRSVSTRTTTPVHEWARASTASRCASCQAASAVRGGWRPKRLAKEGRSALGGTHDAAVHAVTAVLQIGLVIAFGWVMLPFLAVHNMVAWWQLTSANYVEHYGLLRQRLPSGSTKRPSRTTRGIPTTWSPTWPCSTCSATRITMPTRRGATSRCATSRTCPVAERLLWHVPAGVRAAALVQGDGSAPAPRCSMWRGPGRINIDPRRRDAIVARYGGSAAPYGRAASV